MRKVNYSLQNDAIKKVCIRELGPRDFFSQDGKTLFMIRSIESLGLDQFSVKYSSLKKWQSFTVVMPGRREIYVAKLGASYRFFEKQN